MSDVRNTCALPKRRRDQPLSLGARLAPAPFDRRNDLNLMLHHRTTPSACTRTCQSLAYLAKAAITACGLAKLLRDIKRACRTSDKRLRGLLPSDTK